MVLTDLFTAYTGNLALKCHECQQPIINGTVYVCSENRGQTSHLFHKETSVFSEDGQKSTRQRYCFELYLVNNPSISRISEITEVPLEVISQIVENKIKEQYKS